MYYAVGGDLSVVIRSSDSVTWSDVLDLRNNVAGRPIMPLHRYNILHDLKCTGGFIKPNILETDGQCRFVGSVVPRLCQCPCPCPFPCPCLCPGCPCACPSLCPCACPCLCSVPVPVRVCVPVPVCYMSLLLSFSLSVSVSLCPCQYVRLWSVSMSMSWT